ncbi:hypothetical protein E4U17_002844 [Claviceps sp. LM77 group G4]|nr:hypothetical protein E4U17_002844 [Claviceps sp. LM77 group G4]
MVSHFVSMQLICEGVKRMVWAVVTPESQPKNQTVLILGLPWLHDVGAQFDIRASASSQPTYLSRIAGSVACRAQHDLLPVREGDLWSSDSGHIIALLLDPDCEGRIPDVEFGTNVMEPRQA